MFLMHELVDLLNIIMHLLLVDFDLE